MILPDNLSSILSWYTSLHHTHTPLHFLNSLTLNIDTIHKCLVCKINCVFFFCKQRLGQWQSTLHKSRRTQTAVLVLMWRACKDACAVWGRTDKSASWKWCSTLVYKVLRLLEVWSKSNMCAMHSKPSILILVSCKNGGQSGSMWCNSSASLIESLKLCRWKAIIMMRLREVINNWHNDLGEAMLILFNIFVVRPSLNHGGGIGKSMTSIFHFTYCHQSKCLKKVAKIPATNWPMVFECFSGSILISNTKLSRYVPHLKQLSTCSSIVAGSIVTLTDAQSFGVESTTSLYT